ncbi:outer membrane protein [Pseudomonas fluorescens]|jgi:opacity protein-like surface antigen|uniref:outer membrane protein n=1 Tax=Pseudomonas fluorescens TaxID=294 RepID=UPI002786A0F1|nr:outer membrane beta-barrel protein [Pseudomonas fluorescens]MDP9782090.1 opacity protein-like surface antigen [Pseudomonas fluorescens]
MNLQKKTQYLVMGIVGLGVIAPASSFADTLGPYVSAMGGVNWVADQDLTQNDSDFVEMEFNQPLHSGFATGLALGWRFPVGLRPEVELSYRRNTLKQFNNRIYEGGSSIDGKGEEQASSLMANLWYDIPNLPAPLSRFTPYVGGGLGYAVLTIKGLEAGGVEFGGTHRDTVSAWQLGTGVGYELNEHWSMSLDYRYFKTREANFGKIQGLPQVDVETQYNTQSLMLGLRYWL